METYGNVDIQELPLSAPSIRRKVEAFLGSNGLRLEEVDVYLAVLDQDGAMLAGGGLRADILCCIAVSEAARSEGLSVPLISRLIAAAAGRGYPSVKGFTKPENRSIFESLGFHLLAAAPKAILLENGRGLERYCQYLQGHQAHGVVVMNANPFTLGHRYLLEQAAAEGSLAVIPVKEERSRFPYQERLAMIRNGCGVGVDVVEGSDYQISAATFPSYFIKELSDVAETQMRLDIDLFGRHIAPALGAVVRYVGSEPSDALTARYNALLQELLPSYGVQVVEIRRSKSAGGRFVSATMVREALDEGCYSQASALVPASTRPYLLSELAARALRLELETPLKPGLVGPDGSGAHKDMDFALMQKGIAAIRPFFPAIALATAPGELRRLGIAAEAAMLEATGGVNTHRGAIFALGLALSAAARVTEVLGTQEDMQSLLGKIAQEIIGNALKDSALRSTATSGRDARAMALSGYETLFCDWLPYYRRVKGQPFALQQTLLRIVSTLDDTCVLHRAGAARAAAVKAEALALLEAFSEAGLAACCRRFAAEGISPGGAADMLALTLFMDSIFN